MHLRLTTQLPAQIWLDHVRVPRDDLLDAFASVAADGTYSSPIKTVSARFGTMVGGLTTGQGHRCARNPAAGCDTLLLRVSVVYSSAGT